MANFFSTIFPLSLAILLFASACGQKSEQQNEQSKPLRYVKTFTVSPGVTVEWREFPGEVAADQTADLGFRISGKLEKIRFNEGEYVNKEDVLAQLDITDIEIQLAKAEAEFEQIHADYERGQALVEKGVISRSDFDKLKAQNASAKANLQSVKRNLEYSYLKAPFDGQIAKRWIENYEEVSAMQTVVTLQDLSSVNIKVSVPESLMINVKKGATPNVEARFDAIAGKTFPLTLKEVSTQADDKTNTFEVTFTMDNILDYNILPGMSVTVRGQRQRTDQTPGEKTYIPAQAVLDDGEHHYVFVAKPTEDQLAIVSKHIVTVGELSSAGLEILSGIEAGDKIVTAGMSKMSEGLLVKLL